MKWLKYIVLGLVIYWCLPWLDKILIKTLHRSISSGSEYKTEVECVDNYGDWGKAGIYPNEFCRLPASDAGKACIAGWQCETGLCVAQYKFRNNPILTRGQCSKYMSIFGCTQEVHFGIPKNAICRD